MLAAPKASLDQMADSISKTTNISSSLTVELMPVSFAYVPVDLHRDSLTKIAQEKVWLGPAICYMHEDVLHMQVAMGDDWILSMESGQSLETVQEKPPQKPFWYLLTCGAIYFTAVAVHGTLVAIPRHDGYIACVLVVLTRACTKVDELWYPWMLAMA
jgi:hypothetical protein